MQSVGYWVAAVALALGLLGVWLNDPGSKDLDPKEPAEVGQMEPHRARVPAVPDTTGPFPTRW